MGVNHINTLTVETILNSTKIKFYNHLPFYSTKKLASLFLATIDELTNLPSLKRKIEIEITRNIVQDGGVKNFTTIIKESEIISPHLYF